LAKLPLLGLEGLWEGSKAFKGVPIIQFHKALDLFSNSNVQKE